MAAGQLVWQWQTAWTRMFAWRRELSVARKLALCAGMALLTGAAAQVRISLLPLTPVPITGQVFAVLLAGVLLGGGWAALSQLMYVALGACGVPWFAGFSAGLVGLSAGYLIGFMPAAMLVGYLSERCTRLRRVPGQVVLMLAGVAVIYLFGAVWFAALTAASLQTTIGLAVLPFIPFDLAKAVLAALIAGAILPRDRR